MSNFLYNFSLYYISMLNCSKNIIIHAFMQHFILVPSMSLTATLQKLQTSEDTVITVDAKAAGKGKVTCKVQTPQGMELDMDVVENHDGTFDIYYTAPEPGKYVITIRFGGQNIPKSPFQVVVSKDVFKLQLCARCTLLD